MRSLRPRRVLMLVLGAVLAAVVLRLATADSGGVYDPTDAR